MSDDACKLFVAGLPDAMTEETLRQVFEATGAVVAQVSLPRDRATGRPRGFGFVTLGSPDEANSARQALDGSMQAGRSISVRAFRAEAPRTGDGPREPRAAGGAQDSQKTLYVGNLPYDTTEAEVTDLFNNGGCGPVARVHLPTGEDGRMRGFGFVTLSTTEGAQKAVDGLGAAEIRGRRLSVSIAHARGTAPRKPSGPGGYSGGYGGGGGPMPGPSDFAFRGPPPFRGDGPRPDEESEERKAKDKGKKKVAPKADRHQSRREREGFRVRTSSDLKDDDD